MAYSSLAGSSMTDLATAQRDMKNAYIVGAPGVFVSGLVWLVAGALYAVFSSKIAFAALFVGGMLIVPVSLFIARALFGAPRVASGNPLQRLGFESTIVLFAGILLAYVLLAAAPPLVFPALALAIGARYFAFRTIYGEPLYWALGIALVAVASAAMLGLSVPEPTFLLIVGGVECAFAILLLVRRHQRRSQS
ncbi:DUF7010 family protein [Qipengyuania spongiae]|uniref:Uncharacterized protein n=1 Tax=Qipengyuania spongiae TaxID=2909673 RepID=A0ABY5T3L0_9SPHN|nr:hypothetical protein [Qipengyuania spongiae]UVI39931.1 hypothetical protein L1F33_02935 [Qipengyuania spongiae]